MGARRKCGAYRHSMNNSTGEAPRAWQRMLSGRRLNLLDPSPLDIEISDIAHGLARVPRWNGQTSGDWAFSVAQHSLLVERITGLIAPDLAPRWRLAALLHDGPEYVIGDLISPFKAMVGGNYRQLEDGLLSAIHRHAGLPEIVPATPAKTIKNADRLAAWFEATQLAGFSDDDAARFFPRPRFRRKVEITLEPMPPAEARAAFLTRYRELRFACGFEG